MNIFGGAKVSHKDDYGLIVVSDAHINSTTAISPKVVNLDDGGTYHASPLQRMLLEFFEDFVRKALSITKGYKRVVVINGDVGELDSKKRSNQLITLNKATILKMVIDVMSPLVDEADALVVMRGTPAHTGKSSYLEEMFASDFEGNTLSEITDVNSHYHFQKVIGGVGFDIAHHGRMGGMRHTQKGYAVRLAQDTMDKYRDRDETPPDVVIRSHNHRRADSGDNWSTFAMFTPCWQLPNEFIYRIGGENDSPNIGGDIFLCHPMNEKKLDTYAAAHEKFTWYPLKYIPEKQYKIWSSIDI